jgi:hypothetical protein
MRKIRVGDLAGVPLLGVTVIATANPCKIERVGAIPSISTNFLPGGKAGGKRLSHWVRPVIRQAYPSLYSRVAQQKEQQLAKLKAAAAIPAVGTNFFIPR